MMMTEVYYIPTKVKDTEHLSTPPSSIALQVSQLVGIFVSSQMTLTADGLICNKICATYNIETILGRFGPLEVPHAGK